MHFRQKHWNEWQNRKCDKYSFLSPWKWWIIHAFACANHWCYCPLMEPNDKMLWFKWTTDGSIYQAHVSDSRNWNYSKTCMKFKLSNCCYTLLMVSTIKHKLPVILVALTAILNTSINKTRIRVPTSSQECFCLWNGIFVQMTCSVVNFQIYTQEAYMRNI